MQKSRREQRKKKGREGEEGGIKKMKTAIRRKTKRWFVIIVDILIEIVEDSRNIMWNSDNKEPDKGN